jgi:hypothetical protein
MRQIDILWTVKESAPENIYLTTLLTIFKPVLSTAVGKPKYFTGKYWVCTFSQPSIKPKFSNQKK